MFKSNLSDISFDTEPRYLQIIQALPTAIYTCDAQGYVKMYNHAAAKLWGREPEIGKDLWCGSWKIYNNEGVLLPFDSCPMALTLKEKKPVRGVEIIVEQPGGKKRNVLPHPDPVFDTDGNLVGAVNLLVDITEQKAIETALRKSEENFRQLAEFVPQIIWTATADGYPDYYNNQWHEYTGLKEEYGESWLKVLHPDDVEVSRSKWLNAVKTGEPYNIEYRFKDYKTPGQYRWFLGRALPVRDSNNKIVKWFGLCTDIHETKMLAEELERRVAERTKDLNGAIAALKRSNEELEQYAYAASHDLQEPLRKIKTFADRLYLKEINKLDDTSKSYLQKIMSSAERMTVLINDVLNYSRLTHQGNQFVKTDLEGILKTVLEDFDMLVEQTGTTVNMGKLPVIDANPLQILQLFQNLISNSLKFSKEGVPPVINITAQMLTSEEVAAQKLDDAIAYTGIIFSDNGIGFNPDFAEKIFVIFQRLNGRNAFAGSGIGLALCRKIVDLHNGKIYAESSENNGAVFHIILPVTQRQNSIEIN